MTQYSSVEMRSLMEAVQASFRKLQFAAPAMSGGKPRMEPTLGKPSPASPDAAPSAKPASAAPAPASAPPASSILDKIPADKLALLKSASKEVLQKAAQQAGITLRAGAPKSARPYRIKIGDKVGSYQVLDNKWREVRYNAQNQLEIVRDAPPYLIANLNVLKKKIDAQRATGNLTDSRKPRSGRIL